jgi:hypothetical protein
MRLITGNLTKIAKAEINFACRKQVTAEVGASLLWKRG